MFTLGQVTQVKVLLLLTVNVTLEVHHGLDIVVEHFGAHPALHKDDITMATGFRLAWFRPKPVTTPTITKQKAKKFISVASKGKKMKLSYPQSPTMPKLGGNHWK